MGELTLLSLIQCGTPVILLGLIITNAWQISSIKNLSKSMDNIKKDVQWKDTCKVLSDGLEDRIKSLECVRNSKTSR